VEAWVTLCPVWIVPQWLPWLARAGCRRLVAVSSMSVVAKAASPDRHERAVAARLAAAEAEVTRVAAAAGVGCVLLRPTMIYDGVRDGNVAAIAAFIRRWGCFPLAAPARGLRQPVHAEDVAAACEAAVTGSPPEPCYALSGRTPLPFRDLVARIFAWLGVPPRMPCLPPPLFRAALAVAHACGLGRGVSAGMVARMNDDLSCGHEPAARDLGFRPRDFTLDRPQEIGPS
jgi:nucleoside-diphosphate-sugar epimerase